MTRPARLAALAPFLFALLAPGCTWPGIGSPPRGDTTPWPTPADSVDIPAEPQRQGDPARGKAALLNDGFITMGIPWSGFQLAMTPLLPEDTLPGRTGRNASVGYTFNVWTRDDGMEIASPNCLSCHAAMLGGKLFIGLGRPVHAPAVPSGLGTNPAVIPLGLKSFAESAEYTAFGEHLVDTQQGGTLMASAALASHRDQQTLRWSSTQAFDAHTDLEGWVDVPPWWRTKKKTALYANGSGRGDHVHHMMNMTLLSVADVDEARKLDATFLDIAAFLRSIEPPKFPSMIDTGLASVGEALYVSSCASCHGTYGANESYPNRLVPVDEVGTDPMHAQRFWLNREAVSWFNGSAFYGENARFDVQAAYVAPPLDGIWATAPFFHNGSVPTLEGVLDSSKRPALWPMSFGVNDYDLVHVGWKLDTLGATYDTRLPGLSNGGHTYADALTPTERTALLEYLKTL